MNSTSFALKIALPVVFVSILIGLIVTIITLAIYIISQKNHRMKTHSRHTKYDSVELHNTYELTLQVTVAILDCTPL